MASIDLGMDDIFDEQDAEEDLFAAQGPIPDLPPDESFFDTSATAIGEDGDGDNDAVLARIRDLSRGAAKRTVKRVQPKLDAARLTGERGIAILPKVFKDVKLKGRGHEAEDLRQVMRDLEHWTHRLFPKMPFDEVLERIEKLGTKKEVQTCMKRMRLDMPALTEEVMPGEDGAEEDILDESGDVNKESNTGSKVTETDHPEEEDVMDEIMREEEDRWRQIQSSQTSKSPANAPLPTTPVTPITTPVSTTPVASVTPTPVSSSSLVNGGLTAEQVERMERNKRMAQEKRLAKHGLKTPSGTPSRSQSGLFSSPLTYPATPSTSAETSQPSQTSKPSECLQEPSTTGRDTAAKEPSSSVETRHCPSESLQDTLTAKELFTDTDTAAKPCLAAESLQETSADINTAADEQPMSTEATGTSCETVETLPPSDLLGNTGDQQTEDELLAELEDDEMVDDHDMPSTNIDQNRESATAEETMDVDANISSSRDHNELSRASQEGSLPPSVSLLD